jgi:radical SAM protein with 4Fe4S-binding SPASM domain
MPEIRPNANFYSLTGSSVDENISAAYKEYRRSWIEYPTHFKVRDFPLDLDIESTSRCNLKCTFCDKLPVLGKGRLGDMDMALYKKIIDEGAEHNLWAVKLSYRGEPLLHRNIAEMVRYAKKKGVLDVYFNTNGMLLDALMSERLIDVGLDRISISVEGVDPIAFEKERVGAKFDIIAKNIETLIEIRKKKRVVHPKVRIQTVYSSKCDLEGYKAFWVDRCDEVAAVDYKDGSSRRKGIHHDWACPQLWQRMTIEWDGTILPCNNDDIRTLSPGNVKERTIYDCWHDARVEAARLAHRDGRSHEIESCDGCPWRTTQIIKSINSR